MLIFFLILNSLWNACHTFVEYIYEKYIYGLYLLIISCSSSLQSIIFSISFPLYISYIQSIFVNWEGILIFSPYLSNNSFLLLSISDNFALFLTIPCGHKYDIGSITHDVSLPFFAMTTILTWTGTVFFILPTAVFIDKIFLHCSAVFAFNHDNSLGLVSFENLTVIDTPLLISLNQLSIDGWLSGITLGFPEGLISVNHFLASTIFPIATKSNVLLHNWI